MNDIIQLLPDTVANQIAAGEVIQRPASIIKELVENSLDAGASRIQVIVADAGKTSVQVIDDGKGMSETDARLSFERHATSKIKDAADLFALTTMGFRGEALASVAAVAQVVLRTRREEDELGVEICIEGSKVISQEMVVCPVGANFIVKNLFFNTPVRRRFLGTERTELKNIMLEFERIALAHPEISLSISTPDAVLLDLPASSFRQRIVNIFGKKLDKHLLNVQVDTSVVKIIGFVGTPESSKKKGAQQFLFVNGRFMKNLVFAKAIMTAYDRLIPDNEQVPFFLQFFVAPGKIDVNIHPTKTEIKFEDSDTIFQIILAAVREALGKFNAIPTIDFDNNGRPDIPLFTGNQGEVKEPRINFNPEFNPFNNSTTSPTYFVHKDTKTNTPIHKHKSLPYTFDESVEMSPIETNDKLLSSHDSLSIETMQKESLFSNLPENERSEWEIGTADFLQYKGRYLLSAVESGLLIIDAHRAHTRILYEEYLQKDNNNSSDTQGLLFAHILELPPNQSAILEAMSEEIENLGFNVSPLGGGSFSVLGVPSGIEGMDPVALLQNIVNDAVDKHSDSKEDLLRSVALTLAKRTAIPVGQHLSLEEMRDLASKLFLTSNPNQTPDGRLILTILPHENLTTRFRN